MSPAASCLVRVSTAERPKKRVRFSDTVGWPAESAHCPIHPTDQISHMVTSLETSQLAADPESAAGSVTSLVTCPLAADSEPAAGSMTSLSPVAGQWPVAEPSLPSSWTPPPATPADSRQPSAPTTDGLRPVWWNDKVSTLGVTAPLTVLASVRCRDAIDIMHQHGFDQLPVVDHSGNVTGVVTLGYLMTAIVVKRVEPSSPVGEVMFREFATISRDETLGIVSAILDERQFALIVHRQRWLHEKRRVATKEVVIGIVTQIDLLAHIARCLPA